jgi:predicted exporter
MKAKPVIYRISYSVYDEVVRPLPQFYFYVEANSEQQALEKLNAYAEEHQINYRSVAVGYTLAAGDLPSGAGGDRLSLGIAIQRGNPKPMTHPKTSAAA